MEKLVPYIIYFFVYSFIGYIIEIIYCSIAEKRIVSRGFLFGPILPVYGFGMVAVLLATKTVRDDLVLTFLVSMLVCSTIEYFTSWLMETLFQVKWWDYSEDTKFNLNGRICLHNSLLFGIAGCLIVKQIQPIVDKFYFSLEPYQCHVAIFLLVLVLLDTVFSAFVVSEVKSNLSLKFGKGDQTNEIKKLARRFVLKLLTGKTFAERKIKQAKKLAKKKQRELKRRLNM
ncbi:putative ABC transporter permease [Candidatus Saccharibacteria bacterium]|nr:putative ABC transporter permease [Candidatus Saccharibacteria bacterium]